jgi:hypothetical protein
MQGTAIMERLAEKSLILFKDSVSFSIRHGFSCDSVQNLCHSRSIFVACGNLSHHFVFVTRDERILT